MAARETSMASRPLPVMGATKFIERPAVFNTKYHFIKLDRLSHNQVELRFGPTTRPTTTPGEARERVHSTFAKQLHDRLDTIGTTSNVWQGRRRVCHGNIYLLARADGLMETVDWRNPANPRLVETTLSAGNTGLFAHAGYDTLAMPKSPGGGVEIYDVEVTP